MANFSSDDHTVENAQETNALIESIDQNTFPELYNLLNNFSDYSVLLGHNWDREFPNWAPNEDGSNLEASIPTKVNAMIGVIQFALGTTNHIVLSGGNTTKNPTSEKTEASVMSDYIMPLLTKLDIEISKESIIIEDRSVDTQTNAKECLQIIENGFSNRLITNKWHMNRALPIFKRQGVPISMITHSDKLLNEVVTIIGNRPGSPIAKVLSNIRDDIVEIYGYHCIHSSKILAYGGPVYHIVAGYTVDLLDKLSAKYQKKVLQFIRTGKEYLEG